MKGIAPEPKPCPDCGEMMTGGYFRFGIPAYPHQVRCEAAGERLDREYRARLQAGMAEMLLRKSGLPVGTCLARDLDDYRRTYPPTPESEPALSMLTRFVEAYRRGSRPRDGLTLLGAMGTGKTTAILSAAVSLIKQRVRVRFESVPGMYNRVLTASREGGLQGALEDLASEDVLILDDLGREKGSQWWIDQVLFPLVDERQLANRPILITTNYSWEDLLAKYERIRDPQGNFPETAVYLIDRLRQRSGMIPFGGTQSHREPKWRF